MSENVLFLNAPAIHESIDRSRPSKSSVVAIMTVRFILLPPLCIPYDIVFTTLNVLRSVTGRADSCVYVAQNAAAAVAAAEQQ
eukprot:gene5281-752_t